MKIYKISINTTNEQLEDIEDKSSHFIKKLSSGDVFERAVWGGVSSEIVLNDLGVVGIADSKLYPDLRAIHVTSDAEFWIKQLSHDYNRSTEATIIEIYANDGDLLFDDPQYAMKGVSGFSDSFVLVTGRKVLKRGIDFEVTNTIDVEEDMLEFEEGLEKYDRTKNPRNYKLAQDNYYTEEVARNTKDPEILKKILKRGNNDEVSYYAVLNIDCPPEALEMVFKRGKDDWVSRWAILNPNCPPEVLSEILKRRNDDNISWNAASNKNCPPEVLAEVLKRGKDDDVSYYAFKNPNCPPLEKIKWMRSTGKIGKEDPSKHIIQYEEEKIDEDLEKLKKMISFNLKNYKLAQENYYTEEMAKNTKNSEILKKILKRGNDDWVSQIAASNENCPPKVLEMVLKRGKNDEVSYNAAQNINCSPETLEMVLKRGNNDGVSYYATENKNCPPEALANVLKRGNNDEVSYNAARNENCPPEALEMVLKRGNDDGVSRVAASNENCPPEVLTEVLKRGKDDVVSQSAAENINCPPEALEMVLKREKNDQVSYYAAMNINCPPQIKIRWMRNNGIIGKEDPTKHIIQYDLNEKEERPDEDLEKLRKMISKN